MLIANSPSFAEQAEVLVLPRVDVIGTQEQLLKTPSSATIIKQEELESSHVLTINEALRKAPGVVVRDEEGLGIRPNISIRGLNPTRSTKVLLLEDGIPLSFAPYGDNASYYFPSIDRFSSIEVLKGSEQIKYGPQTAGGLINFITPNAPEKFGGHMSVTAGNRDYLNTKINVGGKGVLFDYTHKEGDGARDNTHSNIEDLNVKMTKSLGEDHAITVRANWFSEDSQVSYTGLTQKEYENFGGEYNPFNHDSFKATRYGVSATHDWQINTNALLTTNLYYSYFDRDWWRQSSNSGNIASGAGCTTVGSVEGVAEKRLRGIATNGDDCQGVQGRLRTYDTYGVEPRLTVTHAWGELQLGAKAHFEEQNRIQINGITPTARTGTTSEKNKRETDAYSGFISNRFDIGQFSITPAVRYEHIENERTNRLTGAKGEASLHEWIPGIGFAYNPNDNLTVFAGVHEGFAPPRTEDLISNTTGGVLEVSAEKSTNYELGFRAKPVKGLNVAATAFHNDFKNLIAVGSVASNLPALAQGEASFTGLELSGQYDFDNGFYSRLAYTWLPVAEQDSPFRRFDTNAIVGGSAKGNRQPYAPENTLTVALGYKVGGWNAQLEAVHVGEQYADFAETKVAALNGQNGEIASYTIYNAALNYKYEPYKTTFFVTGKNLLDKDYITDRTRGILTGMPRLVQVGARYDF
ncbi:TonB-dependent receptor domain-containing protein [Methylotenera sp.]|uniref:TonB-dependent receptor family protein n=2 Tax=Methylotenera sp. TaxID=2051956 RepID=UPI002730375D|nr:TonB-dependent receptor [Methylotenera sp.]